MNKPKNEIGNKYHRLTVIRRATPEEYPREAGKPAMWLCKCDCGNYTFVAGSDLRAGTAYSCGCYSREKAKELAKELGYKNRKDLTGKKFGKLTVKKYLYSKKNTNTKSSLPMWLCQCDCGNYTIVQSGNLISGHTTSCGCNKMQYRMGTSNGEVKIAKILREEKIPFSKEYTFSDLLSPYGEHLRFDFAIYDEQGKLKCLLEYNGIQHYKRVEYFQKTRADFLKQQGYDQKKISYCLAKGIPLYIIPYTDIDDLEYASDLIQEKYRVRSRYHNIYTLQ